MGKVVASYLVRVTLRERDTQSIEEWAALPGGRPKPDPDVHELESLIGLALYEELPYFSADEIRVTAERTDR